MKSNNRIAWIDNAKFIGIFFVVMGHLISKGEFTGIMSQIYNFIYLFHMPMFFIISGILYKKYEKSKKLFYTILLPYLLYQIIYLPYSIAHYQKSDGLHMAIIRCLGGVLSGDGYVTSFSNPACTPCWFIYTIIVIRILFERIKLTPSPCFYHMAFS